MQRTALPIDPFIPEALRLLEHSPSLVVSAAPGAGKTTRLPPALAGAVRGQVIVLEPRRIAAVSAPQRIAEEQGWELGRETGYQVRFENRSSRETRLLFLTEALLLRRLARDPELRGVGCVVLDEFHERSVHVDLALGALRELQQLARPDLRIVVMSATLEAAPLVAFLGGAALLEVPGKLHPLTIHTEAKAQLLRVGPEFTERLARLVQRAMQECPAGDLLCFLPGRGEIERLRRELEPWAGAKGFPLLPLHGQLELAEQRRALEPARGARRIVLSTNVAESSLTVRGVRIVVDSGLQRISQLHPRSGFPSLGLARISKASATQRAGRAAREGAGTVYRAWSGFDEQSMRDFDPPEIQRCELAEPLLLLGALGIRSFGSFSWFEAPPGRLLSQAQDFLRSLGALEANGALSPLGRKLQAMPVHPRLGRLLLEGAELGIPRQSAELAALLSEPAGRLPPGGDGAENDLQRRWQEWKRSPARFRGLERSSRQLAELLPAHPAEAAASEEQLLLLLLHAYRDRLCRRRRAGEPEGRMVQGRGVRLHPDSSVRSSEYFLALELSEGRDASETLVFEAAAVPEALLERELLPQAQAFTRVEWDEERGRFFTIEGRAWQGLPLGREHRRPAEPDEISGELAGLVHSRFAQLLQANRELGRWFARLRFLAGLHPQSCPVPEEEAIREALEQACFGENSLEAVFSKELLGYFENGLPAAQRELLARECPTHLTVPTGNRLRIEYSEEQGPLLEVRLQELFGLKLAPLIAGRPLTLVLLAPNHRPVQVTKDLASFWKNGYPEVRKELRARYPKHSWPEDPLNAPPQSKGRPRNG